MKYIFLISLFAVLSSCGNPHISNSDGNFELSNPPVVGDDCEEDIPAGIQFYFGEQSDPLYPTVLQTTADCLGSIREDFNNYSNGHSLLLTNSGQQAISYELTHRTGPITQGVEVNQFFGSATYNMEIQNPVTQYGASGTDSGVNTLSVDNSHLDTLVWKFSEAISFFGARVVSWKKNSTIRLFDCNGMLMEERLADYPIGQPGYGFVHHVGFTSDVANVCYVALTGVHNDAPVAIDDAIYGK